MSALLAISVFVSNGLLGSPPKIDFTAMAEGEDVSESTEIIEEITDSESSEENNIENPDDSEQTDQDGESIDIEDVPIVEDEEVSNAEDDIEQPDVEEEQTEEDIEIVAEDVATLAEDDAVTTTPPKISIKPIYLPPNPVPFNEWIQNGYSENNPYVLKSDSSFTLCGTMTGVEVHKTGEGCGEDCSNWTKTTNGYCIEKAGNFWFSYEEPKLKQGNITREAVLDSDGNPTGEVRVYVTYKADTVTKDDMFNGIITFDNGVPFDQIPSGTNPDDIWEQFHISVRPSFIKVYDRITERDMDKVNEYVDGIYLLYNQTKQIHDDYIWNSYDTPYKMLPGQSVSIRGINGNNNFTIQQISGEALTLNPETENKKPENTPETSYLTYTIPETYTTGAKFVVSYDTGCTDGKNNPITEKFFFEVAAKSDDDCYDHADIEVADNSIYTKTYTDAEGNKYETKYEAYVSNVIVCAIWKDNQYIEGGNVVCLKNNYQKIKEKDEANQKALENGETPPYTLTEDEQKTLEKIKNGDLVPRLEYNIPGSDYWKDPLKTPKSPQFELTSKYVRDENDHIKLETIYDNLQFSKTAIKTATFWVDLLFIPVSQTKTTADGTTENMDISLLPNCTASDVRFDMNEQSVQDAYNKCPDHSGLDFTISQSYFKPDSINIQEIPLAEVTFNATKKFTHGTLADDMFGFVLERYNSEDGTYTEVETVRNEADGEINFTTLKFKEQGEYKFRIKELIPENDNTIIYDDSVIDVTVTVRYNEADKKLETPVLSYKKGTDTIEDIVFTNINKVYNLPSAGGPGVYIYIISGTGLMLSAALMYRRKRKEE